jgi:hypothetical protein
MGDSIIALNLVDNTAIRLAVREVDDQSLAVGLFYIDNYDEVIDTVEEVRKVLLIALIDRKVSQYISAIDGLCSKIEKDKYLVILRKKSLQSLQEGHFDILEDVKKVSVGNEIAVTLSLGFGLDGLAYTQNYEFARNAVDLALGRGGDQAIIKSPDNVVYYGGKTRQVEKNTRVKARVKAQALKEIIRVRDAVFIMGHKLGDPDSKTYAEKIMLVRQNQVTPLHFHWSKMEDIINRGGADLAVQVWLSDENEGLSDRDVPVTMDGITKTVPAGTILYLKPGESITMQRYLYHTFWGEGGDAVVGEVSMVNDDAKDNRFLEKQPRFPGIDEDEAPEYLLCNEYPPAR